MIINDPVSRFESNIGVNPHSVSLMADWTNSATATNIEMDGPVFSSEAQFGDGLTGIGTLQDIIDNIGIGLPNPLEWDWHEWLLAVGGGYTFYKIFFSETGRKRRAQSKLEKEIYKNQVGEAKKKYRARKKAVKESYPLLAF